VLFILHAPVGTVKATDSNIKAGVWKL
jgi:hypothetical protein